MPDPKDYETEDKFMEACIPMAIEEGMEQDQAAAMCYEKWEGRNKTLRQVPMLLTKAEKMADGRTRWKARANTGQWDLEDERFDTSFWDDVVGNFAKVQESSSKGECCGMPVPILDVAHYSFRLPKEKRNMARAGYPIKLWQDGQALMAQGYFDDTPLGQAAAKAAASRPVSERRVSVGVWPDWGRVELDEDGRRIYKGGRGRAYLDHLAMTAHPADPGTILEVKSMTQKQDALDVLGEDAEELINELEEATTKSMPEGAIVKDVEPEQEEEPQPEAKAEEEIEPEPEDAPLPAQGISMDELRGVMETLFASFREVLDERLAPMEAAVGEVAELKAQVDALGATETEKVQAAIDSGGDWWQELVKRSVQRQQPVEDQEPEQEANLDDDPIYRAFPGLAEIRKRQQ